MQKIVKLVNKGPTSNKHDDDLADRLNSRYTVLILVVFTIVVSSQLYIGKPITCWAPKEFTGSWIKYTNNYCWVKNTYYLPLKDDIPKAHTGERENREILYYQWVPFIMLLQALFFYLPSSVWHAFNQKAGVDCDSILATANKYQNTQKNEGRARLRRLITNQLDRFIMSRPDDDGRGEMKVRNIIQRACCCLCYLVHGKYLIILFMFSKLLYLANVVAQFFILNLLLKSDYSFYGYELFQNILHDKHWINSNSFPRVTMCDFTVRRLGNNHRYTVQCVLPINMYTEKIYAFLWVWMLFIAVVTSFGILQWLVRFVVAQDKYRYVRGHIRNTYEHKTEDYSAFKGDAAEFVNTYLNQDGVFILRLIGHNTNNMTVTDVLNDLFINWKEKRQYPQSPKPKSLDHVDNVDKI